MTARPTRRALLSVWDKTGLAELAQALTRLGIELVSTGGTARLLRDAGLEVIDVAALTGVAGILDGRVKTLHPAVHGGILARRDLAAHMATIEALNIAPIDLVVVNLYPFEATIAGDAGAAEAVEMIDVGGTALIRAAAKNYAAVTVIVDPADYGPVIAALQAQGGDTGEALRRGSRPRRSRAPPPTTGRSRAGSRTARATFCPSAWSSAPPAARPCATARTRISGRPSIRPTPAGRASLPPSRSRARRSPSTIWPTPMPPSS